MVWVNSLFLVAESGDVFLEKHYTSPLPRTVLDPFLDELNKAPGPEDVPPVCAGLRHFILSVHRKRVFVVAVVQQDVPPMAVFDFLHRVVDIFEDYFGDFSQDIVNNHAVIVYEVLEEMMDNGFPLSTEANVLKELVHPPSGIKTAMKAIGVGPKSNVSQSLPTGQLSNIPWRKSEVWYAANDIYVDLIEELDCILDRNGNVIVADIEGRVQCNSQLSGVPELVMSLNNSRMLDDVALHPCVRLKRWEQERLMSFVPPDGRFKLLEYHVEGGQVQMPLQVRPHLKFSSKGGLVDIGVSRKHVFTDKILEDVTVRFTLPKAVTAVNLTPNFGKYTWDPQTNVVRWDIGKMPSGKFCDLKGNITLQAGASVPTVAPELLIGFKAIGVTFSGLQVSRLEVQNEKYKPFKGVKYIAQAGNFIVRTA